MAYKCLKVKDGIIALLDLTDFNISGIMNNEVSINLADYGFLIKIRELEIPIPESLFDFIFDNRVITIYRTGIEKYVEAPVVSIELSKESLIEAKGMYSFWKKTLSEENL